jgi:hypothetical protein
MSRNICSRWRSRLASLHLPESTCRPESFADRTAVITSTRTARSGLSVVRTDAHHRLLQPLNPPARFARVRSGIKTLADL